MEIPNLPGSIVQIKAMPVERPDRMRLVVLEEHPVTMADRLPLLRLAVSPQCLLAVHTVESGTGRVRHLFEVALVDGQLSSEVLFKLTDLRQIHAGSIGSAVFGGGPGKLVVPVPPR